MYKYPCWLLSEHSAKVYLSISLHSGLVFSAPVMFPTRRSPMEIITLTMLDDLNLGCLHPVACEIKVMGVFRLCCVDGKPPSS
jgi:hypothetical protein